MRSLACLILFVAVGSCLSACGTSHNENTESGTDAGTFNAVNGGPGACKGTTRPANDAFCHTQSCDPVPDCARSAQRPIDGCCVLVGQPGRDPGAKSIVRTTDTKKYSDPTGAPPNLECFDPAGYPAKPPSGAPPTVTLQGVVEAFANGCDLVDVKVEIFAVQRTGDPSTDGQPGALVGSSLVTSASDPIETETVTTCTDDRKNRRYTYASVPMYTELMIKTSSATTSNWAELYTYNLYISDTDPDYDASAKTYHRDIEALAQDDFQTIPAVAIARPINPGNGAIGGEVHDCDNIRIQNVRVDVTSQRTALVYFNDDQDNPLPDVNRENFGTGSTALYAALDVKPGWARVAATGLSEADGTSTLVSLGYFDVRVFPDAVTSVTLRGLRPFQVP